MRPSRLVVRQTTAPFAHNRRGADVVDHDVPVLKVTAADGRRRAVVFGYACHNTTMPPADGRYCGVNDELTVLRETGCYADFTMPAAPDVSQTRTINAIYYAADDPLNDSTAVWPDGVAAE